MDEKNKPWLLLLPALLVIVFLFLGGILFCIVQSLNYQPIIGKTTIDLEAYRSIFTERTFLVSLVYSFYIAFGATFLSIVTAIIIAMALRKTFIGKSIAVFTFQFPIPIPHIVSGVAILMLFTQSGFISRIFNMMGIAESPSSFPELVFDPMGVGIILALLWKFMPFIGVSVLALLQTSGLVYEEQATSLGANSWQRFRYVLLPIMKPAIMSTSILTFAYGFGAYELPFLLGGVYPKTLAIVAFERYNNVDLTYRPESMAMSIVITIFVVSLILLYRKMATQNS
ncbi:MAG: ABC transporter permease subunit [Firmicutes bacterium]|nr:ABC transporter permease subunit [Bacillota bacterium]